MCNFTFHFIIIAQFFLRLCGSGHGNHWHDILSRTDNSIILSRKVGGFIWQAPYLYRMFIFMCVCFCVFCHKNCLQSKWSAILSISSFVCPSNQNQKLIMRFSMRISTLLSLLIPSYVILVINDCLYLKSLFQAYMRKIKIFWEWNLKRVWFRLSGLGKSALWEG